MILSVTAGYGHHSTAKALADSFLARGAEVEVVDVLEKINHLLQKTIAEGYLFVTNKYMRRAYRTVYTFLEDKGQVTSKYNIGSLTSALMAFKFHSFITDYAPDAILCSHVTAAQIVNELKRRNKISQPIIGVITDYTIHPFWEDTGYVEKIVTASELLTRRALSKGIREEQIAPLGIPVRPKFSKKISKEEACEKFGLDPARPVVLLMGGSMGYGNLQNYVEKILNVDRKIQILAVCGNNHKQYNKLKEENIPGLHPFGFVNNVDEMMDAADCIITKPGGLTVTESLAKNLPMILMNPIPGQEERNVDFLMNNGMAIEVTKTFPLEDAMYFMFSNPRRLELMTECIKLYAKPNATEDIVDMTYELVEKKKG